MDISVYIRKGGSITVDGVRWYSANLPQGGLELAFKYIFVACSVSECSKMEKLVKYYR